MAVGVYGGGFAAESRGHWGEGLRPGFGFLGLSLALARKPETPAEMLGALLAGRLG